MTADTGLTGWGEMAPLGTFYSPAFAAGARAGVVEIAPHLIGQIRRRRPDRAADGHGVQGPPLHQVGARHTCCDLAARAADGAARHLARRPGRRRRPELYKVVTHTAAPRRWPRPPRVSSPKASAGLQVKVGGPVRDDIERVAAVAAAVPKGTVLFCDANAGWTPFQARQFADATRDIDYVFEQPCTTIEECSACAGRSASRWCWTNPSRRWPTCWRSTASALPTALTLKISRLGGVTRTQQIRDLAVDLGFMITVEDTGGAEIDTAAMAHLVAVDAGGAPAARHAAPSMNGSRSGRPGMRRPSPGVTWACRSGRVSASTWSRSSSASLSLDLTRTSI